MNNYIRNEVVEQKMKELQQAIKDQFGGDMVGSAHMFGVLDKKGRLGFIVTELGPEEFFLCGEVRIRLIHAVSHWSLLWGSRA